jgi:hypothetical protein
MGRISPSPDPALVDVYVRRLDALGVPHIGREVFAARFENGSEVCRSLAVEATVVLNSLAEDPKDDVPMVLAEVATYCPDGYDVFEGVLAADPRYTSLPYSSYRQALRA